MGTRRLWTLTKAVVAIAAAAQAASAAAKPGADGAKPAWQAAPAPVASAPAAPAAAPDDCPPTLAAAQALVRRQARAPGGPGGEGYPRYYSTGGLRVLGGAPSRLWVSREAGVLWSFAYELPVAYEHGWRRRFEAAYRTGGGFTFHCPANSQCLWTADGYGANGVQPNHRPGSLLQVGLTSSYSNPGTYTMECLYVARGR